jgi:Omp85 superfamily domain
MRSSLLLLPLAIASLFWGGLCLAEEPGETRDKSPRVEAKAPDCRKGFLGLRKLPPECKGARTLEYAFLPAVFVQKETGFGFVVYNELSFFTDDKPKTQASRAGLALTITTEKQFIARVPTFINFDDNNWFLGGNADFRIYPNRYYGTGNQTAWEYQRYNENVLSFDYELRRRVWGPIYLGARWNLRTAFEMDGEFYYDKDGEEVVDTPEDVAGAVYEPYINHGFGLQAAYDTRDDHQYPLKGGYHRTSLEFFSKAFGGDYDYLFWTVDARQYIPTFENQVLALQFLSEVRSGSPGFSVMSELGGPYLMRGYYRGRYRANNMMLLQAEYRFPIYKRLSGVGFADLGEVYGPDAPFLFEALRWTVGAGLRFRFGEHTYVRFDMGGNHETFAVIFNGGQAF